MPPRTARRRPRGDVPSKAGEEAVGAADPADAASEAGGPGEGTKETGSGVTDAGEKDEPPSKTLGEASEMAKDAVAAAAAGADRKSSEKE